MRSVAHSVVVFLTFASLAGAATAPPRAQVDPHVVQLEVTDGDDLHFVRLSRAQGLSQQRVTSIVQDQQGFLWFGTQYGLNRYDGYRFKVFKNDPQDSRSVCDVHIRALFSDRDGRIWIGCAYSVDRYDPVTERFVHYPLEPAATVLTSGDVRHISQDRDGRMWFSTGNGLYGLDPESGVVQRFAHDPADPLSLSNSIITSSGEDRSGAFWVSSEAGLDRFDRTRGQVTLHVPLDEPDALTFYEDRAGNFWIMQESRNGLAILDRRTHRIVRYAFASRGTPGMSQSGVASMLEDRSGTLWVGTLSEGVLKFDPSRKRLTRYRNDPANMESLSENRITTLFEDREGHLWTAFHATEPGFVRPRALPFRTLPFDARNPNNLGERLVNVLYEDRDGIVWMGTTGALNRYDPRNGQLTHFDIPGHGVASEVLSVIEDPSTKSMWVGTGGEGLYRLEKATGRMQAFRHDDADPTSLSDDWIIRLFHDSRGRLWIGTTGGLNRFNPASSTFTSYWHGKRETRHVYRSIVEDAQGQLWTDADGDGVQRFDPETGVFTPLPMPPAAGSTNLYKRVQSLHVDHTGAVWAGTGSGLYRYDPLTGDSRYYSERDGLPSNTVSCIFEDKPGDLWMGTSEGISRLDRSREVFKNYALADGLPGLDFTGWSACFGGASGEMLFGGFAGAVAFRPEDVRDMDYVPPMAFTDFQISGVPVVPGPDSPLSQGLGYSKTISLSHLQNSFSIGFTTLSFLSPGTNRFRYRLDGIEHDWQQVGGERRLANYTALGPGRYRFHVQGATSRGAWGEPGLELDVIIRPPWWNTWWFRTILALVALAACTAIYLLRMRQIAHQFGLRIEERVSERTRIARELHDSLLQGFQGLMFRMQAVRALLPHRATEAATLLEASLDAGDRAIAEGRSAVHDLRSSAPVASDLADSLTALGEELAAGASNAPSFRLVVEGAARTVAPLVRDDVYGIAREALRNSVQHSQARHIEVGLHFDERTFILRIRDDGVGIDTNLVQSGRRVGHWGLQGMRERAERFGGKLDIWSERDAGTEIELSIPAHLAYDSAVRGRSLFGLFTSRGRR